MNQQLLCEDSLQLVWAQRLGWHGQHERWQLRFPRECLTLSLVPALMANVMPTGQLVLLRLDLNKGALTDLQPLRLEGIAPALVARHFAWLQVGQEPILRDLWSLSTQITEPALRAFYLTVLDDDAIMAPLFQVRATHHPQHDHVGGLLAHSHEVATTAAQLCRRHRSDRVSAHIAFIGGLLHDMAHLPMDIAPGGQHRLARPLAELRRAAPRQAQMLSRCLAPSRGWRGHDGEPANLVALCDRLSAEVSNWPRAFAKASLAG